MGFPFRQVFGVVMPIAQMLLPLVPGGAVIAPFMPHIVDAITAVEQGPGVSGAAKRAYVQGIVAQSAAVANDARPGSVDVPVAVEAAGHYVDAIISTVNMVQKAKAALPDVPPILAPVLPPSA